MNPIDKSRRAMGAGPDRAEALNCPVEHASTLRRMQFRSRFRQWIRDRPALYAFLKRLRLEGAFSGHSSFIRGIRNSIQVDHAVLIGCRIEINGNFNVVEVGPGSVLRNLHIALQGDHHNISIGAKVEFRQGGTLWIEDHHCGLKIGYYSTFEHTDIAITEPGSGVEIGRECMFAYDIDVRCGDSHSILSADDGQRINPARDILISDRVWVGAHAVILKGTQISEDSVVGAGSIVSGRAFSAEVVSGGNLRACCARGLVGRGRGLTRKVVTVREPAQSKFLEDQ